MSYTPDTPQAGTVPAVSQPIIAANFQAIKTFWEVNHATIDGSDNGKHTQLNMPVQSSDITTSSGEAGVYSKSDGSRVNLYTRQASDGQVINCSAVKGYASVTMSGSSISSQTGDNITIARTSAGRFTATFTTALQDANYVVSLSTQGSGSGFTISTYDNRTTTGFDISVGISSGTSTFDPDSFTVAVFR